MTLLAEHGPMSTFGLLAVIHPTIQRKQLNKALKRLIDKKIVQKRFDKMFGDRGVFYELSEDYRHGHPGGRVEFLHNQASSLVIERYKRLFPDMEFVRDYRYEGHAGVRKTLLSDVKDRESIPDFMMITTSKTDSQPITIGVEIERFHKSRTRIVQKLNKLARGTKLDGLIYLCPGGSLSHRIELIFESRILQRADRISDYGQHFLLLSEDLDPPTYEIKAVRNTSDQLVSLEKWVQVLRETKLHSRRDSDFQKVWCMPV